MGRYTPSILEENDYEMIYVANCYRPLTPTAQDALEVMREIEAACGLAFTDIVNNANLGPETTAETAATTGPKTIAPRAFTTKAVLTFRFLALVKTVILHSMNHSHLFHQEQE